MRIEKICKYCKKVFFICSAQVKFGRGIYCSKKCFFAGCKQFNKILLDKKKEILELYNSGLSAVQIAKYFDVSHQTAFRRLKEMGINLRNGGHYSGDHFKRGQPSWNKGVDNRKIVKCGTCQKEFKVYRKAKYCSNYCWYQSLKKKIPWNKGVPMSVKTREKLKQKALSRIYLQFRKRGMNSVEQRVNDCLLTYNIGFIPQYLVNNKFLVDFYIPSKNLIIEADGSYWHTLSRVIKKDRAENAYLSTCGYNLLRLQEPEINNGYFINKIDKYLKKEGDLND